MNNDNLRLLHNCHVKKDGENSLGVYPDETVVTCMWTKTEGLFVIFASRKVSDRKNKSIPNLGTRDFQVF